MSKTGAIIAIATQRSVVYRGKIIAYRVAELTEFLVMLYVWTVLYNYGTPLANYTYNEMVTYLLVGGLVRIGFRNFLHEEIGRNIRDGALSQFLTRPISYFRYIITRNIGRISVNMGLSVFIQIGLVVAFWQRIAWTLTLANALPFFLVVGLSIIALYLLNYLVGIAAFWTQRIEGIWFLRFQTEMIFSGALMPLDLLPQTLTHIALVLPFSYAFYIPMQVFMNRVSTAFAWLSVVVVLVWIAVLYAIITVVWKRGLKRYEGVGI